MECDGAPSHVQGSLFTGGLIGKFGMPGPHSHASARWLLPRQGRSGWFSQTQPVLSQTKHAMSYKIHARSRMVESGNLPGPPRFTSNARPNTPWPDPHRPTYRPSCGIGDLHRGRGFVLRAGRRNYRSAVSFRIGGQGKPSPPRGLGGPKPSVGADDERCGAIVAARIAGR
jgi:hypothetical protein